MSFLKRLHNIGEAEVNAWIEKKQDPLKMFEQGIRDLKADFDKNLKTIAQLKASRIKTTNDTEFLHKKITALDDDAIQSFEKTRNGQLSLEIAEDLARTALIEKEKAELKLKALEADMEMYSEKIKILESSLEETKIKIESYENELLALKTKYQQKKTTKQQTKKIPTVKDSSATIEMLERMKSKIEQEEILSEEYNNLDRMDAAHSAEIEERLNELKTKLKK